MGGMAVWLTCPSVRRPPFARRYADLDFIASSRERKRMTPFFTSHGYVPERLFNALHGAQRLNFAHPAGLWTVDVIFDELHMSHALDLSGRLAGSGPTVDLADLLLTKLQIWEINTKDLRDALCLLADHPIVDGLTSGQPGAGEIDLSRILALTGSDWGLCHTVERNLGRLAAAALETPVDGAPHDPARQVEELLARIAAAPKSLRWRSRARVGERVRWYETPEEVRHLEPPNGDPAPGSASRAEEGPAPDRT